MSLEPRVHRRSTTPGLRSRIAWSLALPLALASVLASAGGAAASPPSPVPDFGPNVVVLDPSMSVATIHSIVDPIDAAQIPAQFGDGRYEILFKPGVYGSVADPLVLQVGYYTDFAGLGALPTDVTINGAINAVNQCDLSGSCTALNNFWRSISNLTVNFVATAGCLGTAEFWATSQATSLRRVNVTGGNVSLFDYCSGPGYSSGGFIADSQFAGGTVINGSQQQYLVRNSVLDGWSNGVWNQVFAGVTNAPAQSFPDPTYTTLSTNPASREKPFLYLDSAGSYRVFVPDVATDSSGTSWSAASQTAGHSLPISSFFIAKPSDSVAKINSELARGKNLILTPGVYNVSRSIRVIHPDTIVLGMGLATLVSQHGATPMVVGDVRGVEISDLIFDAGPVQALSLLDIGGPAASFLPAARRGFSDPADPTLVSDVYFRVGGAQVGKTIDAFVVNSNNVILDNTWSWRADHGNAGTVGWTVNTADTGLLVTGNNVVATGLFVEHYQKFEVVWTGQHGKIVFFQNENPYDPPNQAAYTRPDGTLGWATIKVTNNVRTFEGWGWGSYAYFNVDPTIHNARAYEVPVTPGVQLHDVLTLSITNNGTIDHVVNDTGAPTPPDTTISPVVSFP
jgi:hypothetical protein